MKRLLLGLGSLAAVIAPVAAVVACGADSTTPTKGANENGAAVNHKDAAVSLDELNAQISALIEAQGAKTLSPSAGVTRIFHLTNESTIKDLNVDVKVVNKGFVYQSNKIGTLRYSETMLDKDTIDSLSLEFKMPIVVKPITGTMIIYNDNTTGYPVAYTLQQFNDAHKKTSPWSHVVYTDILKLLNNVLA